VIGAGTAIYAGSQQKKAAKVGLDAQTDANDQGARSFSARRVTATSR
jgi:hypothetical protein